MWGNGNGNGNGNAELNVLGLSSSPLRSSMPFHSSASVLFLYTLLFFSQSLLVTYFSLFTLFSLPSFSMKSVLQLGFRSFLNPTRFSLTPKCFLFLFHFVASFFADKFRESEFSSSKFLHFSLDGINRSNPLVPNVKMILLYD